MGKDKSDLDAAAEQLQAKADEVLQETGSDEAAAKAGGKTEALRNMAKIVKERAGKGVTDSKTFVSKVLTDVSAYASETSTTASSKYQDAKSRGLSSAEAAKEVASSQFTTTKAAASVHVANVHTNLNKAIEKGKKDGTASTTTDRDLPQEDSEPLSWPYSWIAYLVSLCSGKGTSSTPTTDKDFSTESLQSAAATLTESLNDATKSKASGSEGSK